MPLGPIDSKKFELQKFKQVEKNALLRETYAKIKKIKETLGLNIVIEEKDLTAYEKKELHEMPAKMHGANLLANEAEELFNQLTSLEKILAAYPKNSLPKRIIIFSSASSDSIGGMASGWERDGVFNAKEVQGRIYLNSNAKPEIVQHEFFHYYHYSHNFSWNKNSSPIINIVDSAEDTAYKKISGENNYGNTIFIKEEILEINAKTLIDLITKSTKYNYDDNKKTSIERLNTMISVYNRQNPADIRNVYNDTLELYNKFLPYMDNKTHEEVKWIKQNFSNLSLEEQANQLGRMRYYVIKLIGQKNNLIKEQKLFITDYARTNFAEDLCETYGLMMAGKITKQMLSPKIIEKMEFITGYKFNENTLSFTNENIKPSYFGKWEPARTFEYWNEHVKIN